MSVPRSFGAEMLSQELFCHNRLAVFVLPFGNSDAHRFPSSIIHSKHDQVMHGTCRTVVSLNAGDEFQSIFFRRLFEAFDLRSDSMLRKGYSFCAKLFFSFAHPFCRIVTVEQVFAMQM